MSDTPTSDRETEAARHVQFAEVQMLQADMAQGVVRDQILIEAKDALVKAERVLPGSGAWLLACINAREGKADLCRKWLQRAHKADTLPTADELRASPYLAPIRGNKWFKQFLRDIARG